MEIAVMLTVPPERERERRVKIVNVDDRLLIDVLNGFRRFTCIELPLLEGEIPEDATVEQVWFDHNRRCWRCAVSHPSFPVVEPGAEAPDIGPFRVPCFPEKVSGRRIPAGPMNIESLPQPGTPAFERMIAEQTARNQRNRPARKEPDAREREEIERAQAWASCTQSTTTFTGMHRRPKSRTNVIETTARRVDVDQKPESEFREYMAALPSPQDVASSFAIPAHLASDTP